MPKGTMQPSMWGNTSQNVFYPNHNEPWKKDFADVRTNAMNRLQKKKKKQLKKKIKKKPHTKKKKNGQKKIY